MARMVLYDVRIEHAGGRARTTVRVAAVNAPEARAQALFLRPELDGEVVACRRSQYAVTPRAVSERRRYLDVST